MIERDRKGAERLNGVDAKQGSPLAAPGADSVNINSITAAEIGRCQRHQFGSSGERLPNEFRSDLAKTRRFQQDDFHPLSFEGEPWINVRRILLQIADNLVTGPPFEPVRNDPQTTRSRTG